jgi:hypothetical protein
MSIGRVISTSEPMGEELADAFEKYTQEMEKSSGDNPAYRHSKSEDDNCGGYSLNIPEVTVSDYNVKSTLNDLHIPSLVLVLLSPAYCTSLFITM